MIQWWETGNGPALVLLHGISSGSGNWHKQLNNSGLQQCCHMLAWDAPGYGQSQPLVNSHPSAALYADVLAQMLDDAHISRAAVVGHSLGALVASAFSARYPNRVTRLVLADPAQGYGSEPPEKQRQVMAQREQQLSGGLRQLADSRAAHLLRPLADERDIATVAAGMRRLNASGYLQAASMLATEDIHHWLADIHCPTEVWCGELDEITPPARARELARRWSLPYLTIPTAGHACYLDNAAFFNRQLQRITEAENEPAN